MELNASRIAREIVAIERDLDLHHVDWTLQDAHLWPLYRMEIYRLMFANLAGAQAVSPARNQRRQVLPAFRRVQANGRTALRDARIWLVSDGISYAQADGMDFDRFCEPIYLGLRSIGKNAVLIDRSSQAPRRTSTPMRWWTPLTQRAKLIGTLRAKFAPDRRHERLIAMIQVAAKTRSIELPQLSARRFDALSSAVVSLAANLERRMRHERVATVFIVSYYDVGGYAFSLAAQRCGALAVDVQHGVTGDYHLGYADWRVEPAPGYALLPNCFWSWTQADATVVQRWAASSDRPQRHTVVGGHPFMESWRRGEVPQSVAAVHRLRTLIESAAGRPCVLVTLQPGLASPPALAPLIHAWKSGVNVMWWVRLHPMAMADAPAIEATLREAGVAHWDVSSASALPLPQLLASAHLHCTHSSSAVIEAELLGLPSLVWSEYGAELFEAQIQTGIAKFVRDGKAFSERLASLKVDSVTLKATGNKSSIQDALESISRLTA